MGIFDLVYSSFTKTVNCVKYVFQEHTFKSEYLMLLEIGAFIGYILIIIFFLL